MDLYITYIYNINIFYVRNRKYITMLIKPPSDPRQLHFVTLVLLNSYFILKYFYLAPALLNA